MKINLTQSIEHFKSSSFPTHSIPNHYNYFDLFKKRPFHYLDLICMEYYGQIIDSNCGIIIFYLMLKIVCFYHIQFKRNFQIEINCLIYNISVILFTLTKTFFCLILFFTYSLFNILILFHSNMKRNQWLFALL